MVTPAYNPNNTTYAPQVPYITIAEYKNAPTAVDVSSLVYGGQPAAQDAQLATVIARASSWADDLCYQVLAATSDTQAGQYRLQRDGTVIVPCDRTPILEVDSVSWGWSPSTLAALTDLSNVWITSKTVQVPIVGWGSTSSIYPQSGPSWGFTDTAYVQLTYVNGYPVTLTSGAQTAGASTLTVKSFLGIYAGTVLTIYDGANTEQVTVATTPTTTTIALSGTLQYEHPDGVSVANIPPAIKQAVISLTSCLIKTRGSTAVVMNTLRGGPNTKTEIEGGGMEDFEIAVDLLEPYKRVI